MRKLHWAALVAFVLWWNDQEEYLQAFGMCVAGYVIIEFFIYKAPSRVSSWGYRRKLDREARKRDREQKKREAEQRKQWERQRRAQTTQTTAQAPLPPTRQQRFEEAYRIYQEDVDFAKSVPDEKLRKGMLRQAQQEYSRRVQSIMRS